MKFSSIFNLLFSPTLAIFSLCISNWALASPPQELRKSIAERREKVAPLCQERCRTEIVKYTGAKGHQKWVPHIILKNLNSQQSGSFYREEIGRCV